MTSSFESLIRRMTQAIVDNNGSQAAACFTIDGVYRDVFYGDFRGQQIAEMVDGRFHRDGCRFLWDIYDPVDNGDLGYARYIFSFDSLIKEYRGKRAIFEGVAICRLRNGLITEYSEITQATSGLLALGVSHDRIGKFIARQTRQLHRRNESAWHMNGPTGHSAD